MNDSTSFLVAVAFVVLGVISLIGMALKYNQTKNELISKADSCYKAALIEGGSLLPICGLMDKK